jgi:hypothetical protein
VADSRYVIDIVLRARDEMARALASATGELSALEAKADRTRSKLDALEKSGAKFDETLKVLNSDADKTVRNFDRIGRTVGGMRDEVSKSERLWGDLASTMDRVVAAEENAARLSDVNAKRRRDIANATLGALREEIIETDELASTQEKAALKRKLTGELDEARLRRINQLTDQVMEKAQRLEKQRWIDPDALDRGQRDLDDLRRRIANIGGDKGSGTAVARIQVALENLRPTELELAQLEQRLQRLAHAAIKPEISDVDKRAAEAALVAEVERMQRLAPAVNVKVRVDQFRREGLAAQAQKEAEAAAALAQKEAEAADKRLQALEEDRIKTVARLEAERHALSMRQTAEAEKQAEDAEKRLRALEEDHIQDVARAEAERHALAMRQKADETKAEVQRTREARQTADAYADQVTAAAKVARLRDEAARLALPDHQRTIFTDNFAEEMAKLEILAHKLKQIDGDDVTIDFHAHVAEAIAEMEALEIVKRRVSQAPDSQSWRQFGAEIFDIFQNGGNGIAAFDNQIRGMVTLLIGSAIQPLITSVIALGGELFALGSSAAYAGGALGGALAAGASQAIPVVGLLAATFGKVKGAMDAVQQHDLIQQNQLTKSMRPATKAAQATADDRIANANDAVKGARDQQTTAAQSLKSAEQSLADAHRSETDAQAKLTQARKDARVQIEDLILAEKEAALAAKGAALNQEDAQKALDQALQQGRVDDIDAARQRLAEANLGIEEAEHRARRATDQATQARRGVGAQANVIAAKRAVEDAARGVERAEQGVSNAQRGISRAADGLARAQRQVAAAGTASAAASTDFVAAQGKLQFMLDHMSEAEKQLYRTMLTLRNTWREMFTPVTDIIIKSITRALDRANTLLQDPRLAKAAKGLATGIAGSFDRIVDAFTGPAEMDQFLGFITEARRNLKPVTDIVISLGHAFLNIATAAQPLFRHLLDWAADLAGRFEKVTGNANGLSSFFESAGAQLDSWLKLGGAVVRLLLAIATAGGAEEGKRTVDELTVSIRNATTWINHNRESVRKFFDDVHHVVTTLADVLVRIAKALAETFDTRTVDAIAQIFDDFLIPSLKTAVQLLGEFIRLLANFTSNPFIGMMVTAGLSITLFFGVLLKFGVLIKPFVLFFSKLPKMLAGPETMAAFAGLEGRFGRLGGVINTAFQKLQGFIGKVTGRGVTAGATSAVATAETEVAATAAGGQPIASTQAGEATGKRFGSGLLKSVGGILKGVGAVQLGLSLGTGILSGLQHHSVKAGFQDFFHTLSFGLLDSFEESVEKAGVRVRKALEKALTKPTIGIPVNIDPQGKPTNRRAGEAPRTNLDTNFTVEDILGGKLSNSRHVTPATGGPGHEVEVPTKIGEALDKLKEKFGDGRVNKWIDQLTKLYGAARKAHDNQDPTGLLKASKDIDEFRSKLPKGADAIFGSPLQGLQAQIAKDRVGINNELDRVVRDIHGHFQALGIGPKSSLKEIVEAVKGSVGAINLRLGKGTVAARDALRENFREGVKAVKERLADGSLSIDSAVKTINKLAPTSADARKGVASAYREMASAMKTQMDKAGTATKEGLSAIKDLQIRGLQALGLTRSQARAKIENGTLQLDSARTPGQAGDRNGAATGWAGLPGERGRDTPGMMVGRGEAVLNWGQQMLVNANLRGQDTIQSILKRTRGWHAGGSEQSGYATGGGDLFDGRPSNVNPNVRDVIRRMKSHFPGMIVYATTNHDKYTSSGNVSDHYAGNAVDMSSGDYGLMRRAAAWVMSSGLYRRLKQGIHNPNLSVNDGKVVPSSYWQEPTWSQHLNHIHLAILGAIGKLRGGAGVGIDAMKLLRYTPVGGPGMQSIVDRTMQIATRVANRQIRRVASEMGSGGDVDDASFTGAAPKAYRGPLDRIFPSFLVGTPGQHDQLSPGQVRGLAERAGLPGRTFEQIARGESSYYPGIISRDGGYGLWQMTPRVWGEPARAMMAKLGGLKAMFNPWKNALMARYLYDEAGHTIKPWYGTQFVTGAATGHLPSFDVGGQIPGGQGQPIPILAHAGEWILNATQQSKVASLIGTTVDKLRGALGFTGGPTSYQGGGPITTTTTDAYGNDTTTLAAIKRRKKPHVDDDTPIVIDDGQGNTTIVMPDKHTPKKVREHGLRLKRVTDQKTTRSGGSSPYTTRAGVSDGIFEYPDIGGATSIGGIQAEIRVMTGLLGKLRSGSKVKDALSKFTKNLKTLVGDGGLLDQLGAAIETKASDRSTRTALAQYREKLFRTGRGAFAPFRTTVVQALGPVALARQNLRNTVADGQDLEDLRGADVDALKRTQKRIDSLRGKKNLTDDERRTLADLRATKTLIKGKLADVDSKLAQNLADRFAAQVDLFNAETTKAMKGFDARDRFRNVVGAVAKFNGDGGLQASFASGQLADDQGRIDTLNARIAEARAQGLTDVAEQLQEQVDGLVQKVLDDRVNIAQIAIDAANRDSERTSRIRGFQDRFTDLRDKAGDHLGAAQDRVSNAQNRVGDLVSEQARLQGLLNDPNVNGNMSAEQRQAIVDRLEEIPLLIQEGTQAVKDAGQQVAQVVIDASAKATARLERVRGFQDRVADLRGRAGDAVGAARARVGIAAGRVDDLRSEQSSLMKVLAEQGSNLSDEQKATIIDRLEEIPLLIEEGNQNTKDAATAVRDLQVDMITNRASTITGLFGNLNSIVDTLGNISGVKNTDENRQNLQGIGDALSQASQGLVTQLMDPSGPFAGLLSGAGIDLSGHGQGFVDNVQKLIPLMDSFESGMDEKTKALWEKLINALVGNESALQQNNQSIKDLNGNLGFQSFSSTSWEKFRSAIFNGMGNALPQYEIQQMHVGGYVTKAGVFDLQAGERVLTAAHQQNLWSAKSQSVEQNITLNVTKLIEENDALSIAKRTAWELKTANHLL